MEIKEIKLYAKHKVFDDDEHRWVLCQVIEIRENEIKMIDIDSSSEWEGLEFKMSAEELNNKKDFNPIPIT